MKIGLDIDDCIADYVGTFIAFVNRVHGTQYTLEDITDYSLAESLKHPEERIGSAMNHFLHAGELRELPEIKGAVHAVHTLYAEGHKLYFVTSRSSRATHDTYRWFAQRNLPVERIYFDKDKAWHAVHHGIDLFVDDNLKNLDKIADANPKTRTIVFDRPWNRVPLNRAHGRAQGWEQVLDYITTHKDYLAEQRRLFE